MAFEPLMTLYLTETTDPADVAAAHAEGLVTAVKLYPPGATTNSASGVRDLGRVMPVLEKMAEIGLPLCIHGEVTTPEVDIFDREKVFLDTVLEPLRRDLPELKVTLEHITTADGIAYVSEAPGDIAGTITTHHLMINRNHMLVGGIRPHYYCLPVAKRDAPAGAAGRRDLGQSALLPRHRQRAACRRGQGNRLRLRGRVLGHQHDELPRPCLRGGGRARPAGGLRVAPRARALRAGAERGDDDAGKARYTGGVAAKIETGAGPVTVFDPGHPLHWHVVT
jgi:dihydroorotase